MNTQKKKALMFWTVWFLAASLLILVVSQLDFLLNPLRTVFATLFPPLLITGFLFYLLDPLVRWLEKIKIKRVYSILLVMLLLAGVLFLFLFRGVPILIEQTISLVRGIPGFIASVELYVLEMAKQPWLKGFDFKTAFVTVEEWLRVAGNTLLDIIANGVGGFISKLTGAAFLAITIPVILFYILHDAWKFPAIVTNSLPEAYRENGLELLRRVHQTISGYVSGKGTASLIVGVLVYIGYTFLKLPSALLLAFFAAITNFIPYVGPFIGAVPAVFVAFSLSPLTAVFVSLIVIVVQQGDSNLFTPTFVGKSLSLHPLTVMLVLLAAGKIAGLVGMFIGVPVFAIFKTIIGYVLEVRRKTTLEKDKKKESASHGEANIH